MTVCGTGGWAGPLPGDPDNNVVLTATPAFGGIYVNWTYPMTNSHAVAHALLYRGTTNNFGSAVQRQVVAGDHFYDMIPTGITYYYWIKIVSINGTVGATIGPASATARLMVDDLIEQLTGQIDQDVLATSLKGTLDNISIVNGNLAAEIFDRESGDTSLAAALADVAAGVADANTFITTEISSRVTADSVIAEQISLVAATAGSDLAAVQVTMDAWIGDVGVLEGKVADIGALYTAKLTVNGLVGGFGLYNDGSTVQAGFDVDTFWIGRTSADKRKPFIIEGGVVYIDNAMINQLTADRIDTRGLTIKNILGEVIFGSGTALDWSNIGGTGKAANNATRNVFRGDWATATVYEAGDIVMEAGYGWSVLSGHTSSAVVRPPVYPVSSNAFWTLYTVKGDTGLPGINGTRTAILDMYRNSTAAPTTFPAGDSTYTWSTGQFTDPGTLNSWARVPPAPVVGQDLWVVRQLYSDSNTTTTSVVGWAATTSRVSAASGSPGADGVNGSRTGFLEVYQWATATPTVFPAGTSTYTWATGAFTAPSTPNSWSITPGAQSPGQTLWACSVRLTNNTTVTTDSVTWLTTEAYAIGAAGSNGASAKTVTISASSQVFQVNKALAASPTSITLTAYGQNLTGSPVFAVTAGTATLTGTGNTRALTYSNLATDTATIQVTWDSQVDTITVAKIREGADGAHGLTGILSNESHTVPTDAAGNGGNFTGCATTMSVFIGATDDSTNWTVAAAAGGGVTGALVGKTYTVTALSVDTSYVDLTASRSGYTSIVKRFTITKSRTGITGDSATAYWMTRSVAAISKSLAGVMTPATATFSSLSQVGAGAPAAYAGRFVIANSTDGTTFSDVYVSVANESSKAYTILGTAKAVRVRMYLAGGTSTLLDEETIPVVADGQTGNTGLDGLTVVISNEAHTLPAGNDGVIATYANSGTTVTVYEGATALTASASAVVSAFRIGTITQSPLSTITPGGISYATTVGTIANHGGMVTGTDSVVLTLPITIYRANGTSVVVNKAQTITKSKTGAVGATGAGAVVAVLSNEAHVLPAATDGTVSSYVGSGTQVRVYEGATELQYDGSGLSNGTWTMSSVATNITRGGLTDSGSYLTVADHSTVATGVDASSIVYTLTGKSSLGVTFTITKAQSFSKSKIGATGSTGSTGSTGGTGPAGPTVVVTSDRPATFTATDGSLDAAQADLIFTATTQGLAGPTFAWTFSGLQTNPTASTTATQTITAAQFGSAKAAIVTCTVNSTYVDKITVVRLEKSTASAGATVNQTDAITNAAILAAQTAANNARGEADFAVTAINNIASDSKFTPTEKVFARTQWNIAVSEKVGINAQAALFLVTTENATYNTKFIDLGTYLNAGSTWSTGIPFWIRDAGLDDTETITGSLFRLAFTNFYDARTALLNKVAAAAVHAGNKITSGNVGTFIADAAISNTQIGGTIMSTTFVSGSAGWAINKAGSAEFSNAIFRGSLVGADITGATGTFSGTISAGSVNFASSVGTTTVYATPGTYTLTVPALMNSMKVTMWGAGGGGAGGGTWNYGAGTGGGKSTLATISLSGLTPGATFSITVGAGGSGGAAVPIGTTSSPGVTGNVGAPGGTSFLTGYGSSAGGSGGTTNNTSNPRNATSPYSGSGHSGTNGQGVGGGAGGIYEGYYFVSYNTDAGDNATGYGNGGGGGASGGNFGDGSTAGGAGSNGRVQVEFYDSAGVVLRPEMATLKTELRNQGLTIT